MLNIKYIINNKKLLINNLKKRKFKKIFYIKKIIKLYIKKNNKNKKINKYNYYLKKYSKKNIYFKKKKKILIYKKKIKENKKKIILLNNKLYFFLKRIPNIINNIYIKKYKKLNKNLIIYKNKKYKLNKKKKYLSHIELSKKIKIFNYASNISGNGFVYYYGLGLKIYKALIRYLLFKNKKKGYEEIELPYLVNKDSIYGTGQLPDKKNQIYNIKKDKLYLIPTGEVPLINLFKNKIINYKKLPIKLQSYTNCFRREAGSYGKKVKGLNRLHQFGKVEIIEITNNKNSNLRLKKMFNHIKSILKDLKLFFRIKLLHFSKINITSSITYDFEVYSFGQKRWLEISSLSNCLEYQSYNLNIFYKKKNKKKLCHTLNGSCLSIPRLLITILEMFQNNKKINIPKVLLPFLN